MTGVPAERDASPFEGTGYDGRRRRTLATSALLGVVLLTGGRSKAASATVTTATAPTEPSAAEPAGGSGGDGPPALPSAAPVPRLHFDTHSFVFLRYSTAHSSALYGGYSFGKAGLFVGLVRNLRSGYREVIVGAVARTVFGQQAATFGLAGADASDGKYLQVYVVPGLTAGSAEFSGTIELYEPFHGSGTRQLYLDPVTLSYRLQEHWQGGPRTRWEYRPATRRTTAPVPSFNSPGAEVRSRPSSCTTSAARPTTFAPCTRRASEEGVRRK